MFLTRQQYDSLVRAFPGWMATYWEAFGRAWSPGGVLVSWTAAIDHLAFDLLELAANV